MTAFVNYGVLTLAGVAMAVASLRWLRVAQREHYLGGSVSRFAWRWWRLGVVNPVGLLVAVVAGVLAFRWPLAGVLTVVVVVLAPRGLSLRGRTSKLAWTRRLRTLAAVSGVVMVVWIMFGLVVGHVAALGVLGGLLVPAFVDLACWRTAPLEHRLGQYYVTEARDRLDRVAPVVVAVTGSYGKTSTKGHVAQLVGGSRNVVVTPASFNNRAGLARAVNEHLADGTEVFVAEMGTYGPGEIADLCSWCPPKISVITAIGPVHLERFGTEDRIVEAKSEILKGAETIILNVDNPHLARLAGRLATEGKAPVAVSATDSGASVCVRADGDAHVVLVDGVEVARDVHLPSGVQPTNVACALAVGRALGVDVATLVGRLGDLGAASHRLEASTSATGATILDDTYNSNPAGAASGVSVLTASAPTGRRAVVSPGMVELGSRQFEENRRWAADSARVVSDFVVVGHTNRRALVSGLEEAGAAGSPVNVVKVDRREQAVDWVRKNLGPGDAVLYENDLPDHYP